MIPAVKYRELFVPFHVERYIEKYMEVDLKEV